MDHRSKNTFSECNMQDIMLIKPEPNDEMEAESILPDPLETSVEVKPEVVCIEESNTKTSSHQNSSEVPSNLPNLSLDKTFLNINGVFYVIQKIPEALAQSLQIQNVAPPSIEITNEDLQTKKKTRDQPSNFSKSNEDLQTKKKTRDEQATCPKCGKTLKRWSSLKLHMQMCFVPFVMNNPPFSGQPMFRCENCDYKTKSKHSWSLHADKCSGKAQKSDKIQSNIKMKGSRFTGICLNCNNTKSPLSSKTCNKCGSAKRWQCNHCNEEFETHTKAQYHTRTKCRPDESYYCCLKCDFKSAIKYRVRLHIEKSHAESISSDASNYIEKRKVQIVGTGAEHTCSLCGEKFDDNLGLNRHTVVCKKYELLPQTVPGNIKIEDLSTDSSETDLNLKSEYEEIMVEDPVQTDSRSEFASESIKIERLELPSETIKTKNPIDLPKKNSNLDTIHNRHRKFICRHCEKCNKNIELERSGVKNKKPCKICLQTMVYKCKECGDIQKMYAESVKHVKTVCDQEDRDVFKCAQCNFSSHSKMKLTEHNRRIHGDISATCIKCGGSFTNSVRFRRHLQYCGIPATLECDLCAYITTTKDYMRKHIESNHGKGKPPAPNLSRINSSASRFDKAKPHIQCFCTTCHKRQKTGYRLKRCLTCKNVLQFRCITHDRMHRIDDPQACEHVKAFVELLALECQICSKGFLNRSKFESHKKTCVKIQTRYICTLCQSQYSTFELERLRMHCQRVHKTNIILSADGLIKNVKISHFCHFCSYTTSSKISLEKHMKIHMEKESSSPLLCPKSEKEISDNSVVTKYECEEKDKLNLECKVVLKRLDMNTI